MPSRLQQLRGNAAISGLARDEQVFQSEARAWRLRVDAERGQGNTDQVVAMLDAPAEPSSSQPPGSTALSIPFVQIDAARVAGAVLHPVSGLWYAPHGADLAPLHTSAMDDARYACARR